MFCSWVYTPYSQTLCISTLQNAHLAKCFVDICCHRFKSSHIYWTKHSWLMDPINLMTSKPRRENMFMRSIMPTEHHWKQKHYWKMKAHLFSSVVMCSFLSRRTTWGYPHKMLMMCCLLQGSAINLCTSHHFPSLFFQCSGDEQKKGREWLGLPTFTPHVLSSCVNITAHFKVKLLINHTTLRD